MATSTAGSSCCALRRGGYDVETANDGLGAVDLLREGAFDVIVSDVDMPGMDGVALLRVVRERSLDVPVLLLTGNPDLDSAMQAVEHGALRYLLKPIEVGALLAAVRQGVQAGADARSQRKAASQIRSAAADRAELQAHFENALATLWMAYQPIVKWPGAATHAHEALVRNAEPTLASPPALFAAAERLGRLPEVGRAIRAQVAKTAVRLPDQQFFVNLHPHDLNDPELLDHRAPLSAVASRVVLEVTERASLDELGDTHTQVLSLRRLGYRIAIDDLGAGYAGLSSFAHFRASRWSRSTPQFVGGIATAPTNARIVRSGRRPVSRAREFLVATEGVKTVNERDVPSPSWGASSCRETSSRPRRRSCDQSWIRPLHPPGGGSGRARHIHSS